MVGSLTKKTATAAVDMAFASHVERLFEKLCSGLANEDASTESHSTAEFRRSYGVAIRAHQVMTDHIEKSMT